MKLYLVVESAKVNLEFLKWLFHICSNQVIEQSLMTQCKCHGVSGIYFIHSFYVEVDQYVYVCSGSCQVKTCWRSLPALSDIADRMKVCSFYLFIMKKYLNIFL